MSDYEAFPKGLMSPLTKVMAGVYRELRVARGWHGCEFPGKPAGGPVALLAVGEILSLRLCPLAALR
jgi:hypothetical protein